MTVVWKGVRWFACLAALLCACGREPIEAESSCAGLAPGDLVITELHPNPDGSDGDGEYIELFNASGASVALDGLVLSSGRARADSSTSHRLFGASIGAGDYLVLGNAPLEAMPAHLDYSYGDALGSLRNSDAQVSVRCAQTLIDRVIYDRAPDGRALELDGRLAPDAGSNDLSSHWCASPSSGVEAFPGNFGTPGASNSRCELQVVDGTCVDRDGRRPIRSPAPGSMQIREWMPNPEGADTELEWVEALFTTGADLNAFQLGSAPDALEAVLQQEACVPVDAGQRVVFGASPAAAPRVDGELRFSLGNSGARSIFAGADGLLVDQVDYEGSVTGFSWQVDSQGAVCLSAAEHEYASGNFGTPGEANPSCPAVLGPGQCLESGAPRELVRPRPGDVQITEWMANPGAVPNHLGEWVELRFDEAVDLNGLVLSDLRTDGKPMGGADCLAVPAGAHLVFARSAEPSSNGGLEEVAGELSISLNNRDETLRVSILGQELDRISYARSEAGVATQIDALGEVCSGVSAYGDGDLGTPGLANPPCP